MKLEILLNVDHVEFLPNIFIKTNRSFEASCHLEQAFSLQLGNFLRSNVPNFQWFTGDKRDGTNLRIDVWVEACAAGRAGAPRCQVTSSVGLSIFSGVWSVSWSGRESWAG